MIVISHELIPHHHHEAEASEFAENEGYQYAEKFLLLEDKKSQNSTLKITCGPYGNDFETQNTIINNWANKVKELSEFQHSLKPTNNLNLDKK